MPSVWVEASEGPYEPVWTFDADAEGWVFAGTGMTGSWGSGRLNCVSSSGRKIGYWHIDLPANVKAYTGSIITIQLNAPALSLVAIGLYTLVGNDYENTEFIYPIPDYYTHTVTSFMNDRVIRAIAVDVNQLAPDTLWIDNISLDGFTILTPGYWTEAETLAPGTYVHGTRKEEL